MTIEEVCKIREVTPDDYKELNSWYEKWGFPQVAVDALLPECGFVVEYKGVGVVAGFLYLTDSPVAHPEWIVSNKEFKNRKINKLAFTMLFDTFEKYAKSNGYNLLIMLVKNNFLIKTLEKLGFVKTDTGMTNLIKEL